MISTTNKFQKDPVLFNMEWLSQSIPVLCTNIDPFLHFWQLCTHKRIHIIKSDLLQYQIVYVSTGKTCCDTEQVNTFLQDIQGQVNIPKMSRAIMSDEHLYIS